MMQQFTLRSYVGRDGILRMDVPVGFTERNLEIVLIVQEIVSLAKNTTSPLLQDDSEETILCHEGGVLVADGKLLSDPTDLVQQQRQQRTTAILQWENL